MALYPSLEDMKVDQMMKAQLQSDRSEHVSSWKIDETFTAEFAEPSAPMQTTSHNYDGVYPSLSDYMGLDLTREIIEANMPDHSQAVRKSMSAGADENSTSLLGGMIAPLTGNSLGLRKSQVSHGVRELNLCKDRDGKIGLRVHSVNNGIFVCLVSPNSPAALAGLRFGDQILEIAGHSVAGYSMDQVHKLLKAAPVNGIQVIVRDRPFERTVTMHKDSSGRIGFHFKDGKISALVQDSSAARNGLLTDHQILEINGKNVVGLKDKDIAAEISNAPNIVTITIIPSCIYDHMVKKMSNSLLKFMDHSIPNI